jgi:acetyltransferase
MMGKMVKKYNKPIVLHSLYSARKPHSLDLLRYYNIPVYDSLDVACKCISLLAVYGNYLGSYHTKSKFIMNWGAKSKAKAKDILNRVKNENRRFLLEYEAKDLLRLHGAPVPDDYLATTADEAVAMAKKIDGAVAMKIVSPDILHKSDAGGVKLNLTKDKHIRGAFDEIVDQVKKCDKKADIRGILVSPMAKAGVEVIIGTKIDDQFGPIIMFGLGGVLVEVLRDVSFRVLPLSPSAAKKMLKEIRSSAVLDGVRGKPPCDKKALTGLMLICSEIVEAYPDIQEMDLNPVIVYESGLSVVDARIILKA